MPLGDFNMGTSGTSNNPNGTKYQGPWSLIFCPIGIITSPTGPHIKISQGHPTLEKNTWLSLDHGEIEDCPMGDHSVQDYL